MQNARDSFYEVLRARLATLNPERTVVVRGVTRPALVVDENETASVGHLPDCFHLQWGAAEVICEGALPMAVQLCEIRYATAGSAWNGGVDRGRILAAMDGELLQAVTVAPQSAPKTDFSGLAGGGQPVVMGTSLWWSDVSFAAPEGKADLLSRVARVQVMSYQEAGEL